MLFIATKIESKASSMSITFVYWLLTITSVTPVIGVKLDVTLDADELEIQGRNLYEQGKYSDAVSTLEEAVAKRKQEDDELWVRQVKQELKQY